MDLVKNFLIRNYTNYCNMLEHDTVGTELIIYGTSSIMLFMAYLKRRPWYLVRPFTKSSHIPDQLIKEQIKHAAIIRDVQQKGHDTILLASHRPYIPLFADSTKHLLPIKLAGIQVNGNGYAWLQHTLIGRKTYFVPLHKSDKNATATTTTTNNNDDDDCAICQVYLIESPNIKYLYTDDELLLDIAELLLKVRFAHYIKYDYMNNGGTSFHKKYYKHLAKIDAAAARRESLHKFLARYPAIWKSYHQLKTIILPKRKLLPESVR